MTTILGLIMIYTWIHAIVINFTKLQNLTQYEKIVLCFALGFAALFVIGSIN